MKIRYDTDVSEPIYLFCKDETNFRGIVDVPWWFYYLHEFAESLYYRLQFRFEDYTGEVKNGKIIR